MCGRFTLRTANKQLLEIFHAEPAPDLSELVPRYDVRPSQKIVAIRPSSEPGQRQLALFQWGLILPWAKSSKDYPRPSNSRDYKLDSRMYAPLLRKSRCVIPIDGFFEWPTLANGEKVKVLIERRDKQPIAVAGLWDRFTKEPEPIDSTTMVTVAPNAYPPDLSEDATQLVLKQAERSTENLLDAA